MKEFDTKMEELRKLYVENPTDTINGINKLIISIKNGTPTNFENIRKTGEGIIIGTFVSLLFLIGLINVKYGESNIMLYYFGCIFFMAGLFVALYVDKFGLIFLFSHGCVGLGLMNVPKVLNVLKSPLLTDGNNIRNLLYLAIIMIIVGIILTIFYNLVEKFRKKPSVLAIILLLILAGTSIIQLLPTIFNIPINL